MIVQLDNHDQWGTCMARKGFTSLEFAVALLVIALVAGFLLLRVQSARELAYLTRARAELQLLHVALEASAGLGSEHSYPVIPQGTYSLFRDHGFKGAQNMIEGTVTDPFSSANREYGYASSSSGEYFVFWSVGPDGQGQASVDDSGRVRRSGRVVCVSNAQGC